MALIRTTKYSNNLNGIVNHGLSYVTSSHTATPITIPSNGVVTITASSYAKYTYFLYGTSYVQCTCTNQTSATVLYEDGSGEVVRNESASQTLTFSKKPVYIILEYHGGTSGTVTFA